jgi:hypothetical protein
MVNCDKADSSGPEGAWLMKECSKGFVAGVDVGDEYSYVLSTAMFTV